MAYQPDNGMLMCFRKDFCGCSILGSEDVSTNSFIDFEQMVFEGHGFDYVNDNSALLQSKYY